MSDTYSFHGTLISTAIPIVGPETCPEAEAARQSFFTGSCNYAQKISDMSSEYQAHYIY